MTEELKGKLNNAVSKGQERLRAIRWRSSKEKVRFRDEIRIIPRGVVYAAILVVVLVQVVTQVIWTIKPTPDHHILTGAAVGGGLVLGFLILFYGYVYADAKRRGMNATLWTLLAIFVPYLIGVIAYFIMREPRPFDCPQCGATVSARFNYCPSCKYNLRPTCPQCKREIRLGDKFCPHCAGELEEVAR
ncbi:MAG TPA: zinc ribbon domain-containing protein [Terriglobia bacterium]|nr:zinc ribbon domain-containing protein [Terriglobia bacterium]